MRVVLQLCAAACAALAIAGAAYFALCLWAGLRFLRRASSNANPVTPPVSILKSLKGVDPHMYAAFRSHCVLEYPEYEVLFGASDMADPAVELVRQLQQEFPGVALRVIHCPQRLGTNGKVSNLAQMLPSATFEHVIVNDSDIQVPADYLQRAMRPFANAGTGLVTTLYRAVAGRTVWSKLEALGISTDFMGGVLVAREMEGGVRFGLGATIATTKSILAKIGGLETLSDYLGDDYELGARIAAAGFEGQLADVVVETALPGYTWREFWEHQLRWARNIKDRRRSQYFGLIVTFGLPWAVFSVFASAGAWWSWIVLAATAVLRFSAAWTVGSSVLSDWQVSRDGWLIPLRDFGALGIWVASFFGDTVVWRGERFRLSDGKLQPLE
jgi:ceramide glucosyltransferase